MYSEILHHDVVPSLVVSRASSSPRGSLAQRWRNKLCEFESVKNDRMAK